MKRRRRATTKRIFQVSTLFDMSGIKNVTNKLDILRREIYLLRVAGAATLTPLAFAPTEICYKLTLRLWMILLIFQSSKEFC